ncbi:MAG TPA: hypothetical protein VIV60_00715 [Polyangiaceae bacterium]
MELFLALFLVIAVAFQGWVTYRLWRVDWYERAEKVAQSKFIWLLPILGAVMVYSMISDEDDPQGPTSYINR